MTEGKVMAPKALIQRAEKTDAELRVVIPLWEEAAKKLENANVKLGTLWKTMRDEKLYMYVRKPGSKKGYASFEEYVLKLTKGKIRHATLFNQITQAKLTTGPNAISEQDVTAIGTRKSIIMSKVPEERRTPELVRKAIEQPEKEFVVTAQEVINRGLPLEKQALPRQDFYRKWSLMVIDELEEVLEIYSRLKMVRAIDPTGLTGMTLHEQAMLCLLGVAKTYAVGEECAAREKALDLGEAIAEESTQAEPETIEAEPPEAEDDLEVEEYYGSEDELAQAESEAEERQLRVL